MKKAGIIFNLLVLISTFSCKDEPEPGCPPRIGKMIARVNDTIEWDFKYVSFSRWSGYSVAQWPDSSVVDIGASFVNAGCERELSLKFRNIAQTLEKQNLVKPIYEENHPSLLQPHSIFYTWDVDVLTERFELYEGEPAWIQLSEITDEQVRGTFQGTYVYRQSAYRYWDLPDTLRFHEVSFEADLLVPPVD